MNVWKIVLTGGITFPNILNTIMKNIEPLNDKDLETAVNTIASAFLDDPVNVWMYENPSERLEILKALNRVFLKYGMKKLHISQFGGGKAVAISLPPQKRTSTFGMVLNGLLGVPFSIGFKQFGQFMTVIGIFDNVHKRLIQEPHWYIMAIGVAPELQGKGIGTSLINEVIGKSDRDSAPCYLETTNAQNLSLYEHLGFNVIEEFTIRDSGPKAWAMIRNPQELLEP